MRGVAVCEALSEDLELHFLRAPRPACASVRSRFTARTLSSKRHGTDAERAVLASHGDDAVAYRLQDDLTFAGIEPVIRRVIAEPAEVTHVVLDFSRAMDMDAPAARILLELSESFATAARRMGFVGLANHPRLLRRFEEMCTRPGAPKLELFDQLDLAIEWCEV